MTLKHALLFVLLTLACATGVRAQPEATGTPIPPKGFDLSVWAREPMLKNPVALSFDDRGILYVVETARRSTVDIDIRAHPTWIVDDLANQSIDDLRRFFREKMSPDKSVQNARWLRDLNRDGSHDWRDLMEVKERVHRLEDSPGLGKASRAQVFAEGFNEEVSGVIAGVMPWGDEVFVTVYPDLWRLRDTNSDGVADVQESLFRGFGVHAAFDGHDLHGLTVGPEGKIYFSIGDNGFSVVNREGRRLHHPNTGGVLRMNPDGSDLEVFATGLRNVQEIAFDEFGNMFDVDNDGDLEDERERFVYITEGSDSGWRLHWQFRDAGWSKQTGQPLYNPWIHEKMWVPQFPGQPAHITPPLTNYSVGPGGFKYNPGTALNDAYQRSFFLVQFPVQKITAFETRPKGAAFEMVNEHVFLSGMMASALNFSPDGAMFIADWDGLWAPNDKGAIWRLDDPKMAVSSIRLEVKRLLGEGMRARPVNELSVLLGHRDERVRQRAQFELARRGDDSAFRHLAQSTSAPLLARVHALWGLGQLKRDLSPEQLPLADAEAEVRAQAAKVAGDLRLRGVARALRRLLSDTSLRVRFHAAQALGKIGDTNSLESLVAMLADNRDKDAFLRHAGMIGLTGCGNDATLSQLARHDSTAVRIAAVVALRRMRSSAVAAFLQDTNALVRREAVRAIHDDESIPEALTTLASFELGRAELEDEAVWRRVLHANLRVGTTSSAERLMRVATDSQYSDAVRVEAIECLGAWNDQPSLDRVEGMVRPLGDRSPTLGNQLLQGNVSRLLSGANVAITKALSRIILRNRLPVEPGRFAEWATSRNQPTAVRAQALELLAGAGAAQLPSTLQQALQDKEPEVRLTALRLAATHAPEIFLESIDTAENRMTLPEKQMARRLAGLVSSPRSVLFLERDLKALSQGQLVPELALDVLEGARSQSAPELRKLLSRYEAELPASDPLAKFRPTLAGGNAAMGREIFRTHPNAQCTRCHEAGGEGYQAGPVLTGLAKRVTPEYLLESLIDPSRRIAEGFGSIRVETRNGDDFDGTQLQSTDDTLTLRLHSGETRPIPRRDILRQSTSAISSMPPMGDILSLSELRDVMAYLQSLR